MNISDVEELLIKSVHSDEKAKEFFSSNLHDEALFLNLLDIVEKSNHGDARMEGAYYLSQFDEKLIINEECRLLNLMNDKWDSVAVHIMIALSKIKSKVALKKIIEHRIRPVLWWEAEALNNYFQGESDGK